MRRCRFRALSTGEQVRLLVVVPILFAVQVGMSVISFKRLRGKLLRLAAVGAAPPSDTPPPECVAWAVRTADRHAPGDRTCLMRSLTTEVLLRAYGHTAEHRIGVEKTADGSVGAHSWIERDGDILLGEAVNHSRYESLPPLRDESGE